MNETNLTFDLTENKFLSESQKAGLTKLQKLFQLSKIQIAPAGIRIRTNPLMIGPSGCGKTTLLNSLRGLKRGASSILQNSSISGIIRVNGVNTPSL